MSICTKIGSVQWPALVQNDEGGAVEKLYHFKSLKRGTDEKLYYFKSLK